MTTSNEATAEHSTGPTPVILRVGEAVYSTAKETLLGRDEGSFFHPQFSGRCETDNLTIQRPGGAIFMDVMYYLRVLETSLETQRRAVACYVDEATLDEALTAEAEFYLLPGLEALCMDPSPTATTYGLYFPYGHRQALVDLYLSI